MTTRSLIHRLCAGMIIAALIVPLALSCKSSTPPAPKDVPANPFNASYQMTEADTKFFTGSDSVALLTAATPFYIANQSLPQQNTPAYDRARAEKIAEVKKEAQTLAQTTLKLKPKLEEVRSVYLTYLQTCLDVEAKLTAFATAVVADMQNTVETEAVLEAAYRGIDTTGIENAYARSFLDYMRVVKIVELSSLYLEDVERIAGYAAITLTALETSNNLAVKKAGEQLGNDMKKLDDLRGEALAIIASRQKIDYGLRQLDTASYYFALAANDFVTETLRELEAKMDQLKPGANLSKGEIQVIQKYVAQFEKQLYLIRQPTQSFDKSKLITLELYPYRSGVAYAADGPANYPKAVAAMQGPAKADDAAIKKSGYMGKSWADARKSASNMVTGEVQAAAARQVLVTIQSGWGQLLDVGKIYTDYAITWGYRTAFGIPKDVLDENAEMSRNWMRYQQNLQKNMSGVEVLNNAQKNFETVEKTSGQVTSQTLRVIGTDEWLASGMGEAARLGVGLLTGTASSIYALANQSSSNEELAMAGFSLGLSMFGGSRTIATTPFIKNAEEKMVMNAGEALANSLMTREAKMAAKAAVLDAASRGEREALAKGLSEYLALESIEKTLKDTSAKILENANNLPKGKLWNMVDKLVTPAHTAYSNWSKTGGLKDTLQMAIGSNAWDFALNCLGSIVDDRLKKEMGLFVQSLSSPQGQTTTKPGETRPSTTPGAPTAAAKPTEPSPSVKPTTSAPATLGRADLTAAGIGFDPYYGGPGAIITVTYRVTNRGTVASGNFTNRISLATTQYGTNYSLGNFPMDSIDAGKTVNANTKVTIPASVPGGEYFVTVFVDALQKITESDENNNIAGSYAGIKFTVTPTETWVGKLTGTSRYQTNQWSSTTWSLVEIAFDFAVSLSYTGTSKGTGSVSGTATVTRQTKTDYAAQAKNFRATITGGPVSNGGSLELTPPPIGTKLGSMFLSVKQGQPSVKFGSHSYDVYTWSDTPTLPLQCSGISLVIENRTATSMSGTWRFYQPSDYVQADSTSYRFTLTKQ